jgi:hypothetical protein
MFFQAVFNFESRGAMDTIRAKTDPGHFMQTRIINPKDPKDDYNLISPPLISCYSHVLLFVIFHDDKSFPPISHFFKT